LELRVAIHDEQGRRIEVIRVKGDNTIQEYEGVLTGASRIQVVELSFHSEHPASGSLNLLWMGLTKGVLTDPPEHPLIEKTNYEEYLAKFIRNDTDPIELMPQQGFWISETELLLLRDRVKEQPYSHIYGHLVSLAKEYLDKDPTRFLKDYVVLSGRAPKFSRTKDRNEIDIRTACIILSFVGLVENDTRFAKKACEFALCLASCRYWRESFMAAYPLST
jgi:hypothetical protein